MYRRALLSLLLAGLCTGIGETGLFSKKPAKVNPSERVPELLRALKEDGDENKRFEAAEELRNYDITAFPQIVPALIEALHKDPKPAVRSEAVETLGKLRPASQVVWQALQEARDKDASTRVRMQARASLLGYYWAFTPQAGKPSDPPNQSKAPLIDPKNESVPVIRTQGPPQPPRIDRGTVEPLPAPPADKGQPPGKQPSKAPAPLPPPPSQPSKFSLFGWRRMPDGPSRPIAQTQEPPLADPLPRAGPAAPPPPLPLPFPMPNPLPISTQPASGEGPELPPPQ